MTTKTNNNLDNNHKQNLGNLPIWDLSDLYDSIESKNISSDLEFIEIKAKEFEKNYEVKIDFYKKFVDQNKKNEIFFEKISNENYVFDLRGYINKEISNLNIKNIENIEKDTFSEKDFFYSYRRSCLNKEQDYGRCISVILMT